MSKGNEPAFARPASPPHAQQNAPQDGLNKREYYAALAMQGLCANPKFADEECPEVAGIAVQQADDLLAALDKDGDDNANT